MWEKVIAVTFLMNVLLTYLVCTENDRIACQLNILCAWRRGGGVGGRPWDKEDDQHSGRV